MSPTRKDSDSKTENGHAYTGNEAYETWTDFYKQMADEGRDFYQKGFEMFQKMTPMYPGNEIYKNWVENYQDFLSRVSEETGGGKAGDMNAYRRIYDAWLDTWSRNFETYMRTPEFVEKSGRDLETFSDMQKKMGEMMESYWHAVHLPTSEDIREVYHKLYTIDRKLDELDRRLREIQASQSSASAKKSKE